MSPIVHVSKTKTKWTPGGWAASQSLQILCGSDKQSTADGAVISCQGSPVSQRHLCSTKPAHHHIWETLRCLLKYRRSAKNDRSGIKVTTARARTSEFEQMRIEVRFKKCSTWRETFNINYTFWYISKSTHTASHVHITTKYSWLFKKQCKMCVKLPKSQTWVKVKISHLQEAINTK